MSIIRYRKLPKDFSYPVTKKDMKNFIEPYKDCLIEVDFAGLNSKKAKWEEKTFPYYFCHPIHISAFRDEKKSWHFMIRINAENKDYLVADKPTLSASLLSKVRMWIDAKRNLSHHEPDGDLTSIISYKCSKENKVLLKD